MSELRCVPLEFVGEMPMVRPLDQKLFDLAVKYVDENFTCDPKPRLIDYKHIAVVAEFEGEEPVAVHGMAGMQFRPDFPVWRQTGPKAKQVFVHLFQYFRDYMVSHGWRGAEVMIHADEDAPEEIRCPNLSESLKAVGAKPARRVLVKVR